MDPVKHLSDLQIAVLRTLWEAGEASTAQVNQALNTRRKLALTTTATVLSRLEKQKLVTHRKEGRSNIYRALVTEQQVRRSMVADLVEWLFRGEPSALISHLLENSELDADETEELQSLLQREDEIEEGRNGG
jgi:predicted transcriptional regulator